LAAPLDGLDAAWARAVAALPERLDERSLSVWWDNRKAVGWWAACTHRFDPLRPIPLIVKGYPTKEAALDALAAALREGETQPTWCVKHKAYDHCEDATLAALREGETP
jgi:hypothetical protein